ncbi:uncharacterized mitochondrial protein-like protein [Tanacetum coccineum]
MDLKWQLSLLSMRAKRYFQRTDKKIFINANDTARYDKSNVECSNCHKMGYFARECRAPRNKEGQFRNQDNTRKHENNEDTSSKAMLAIDGVGFDWSDMAEEQVQTNMALMMFSDYEINCNHHQRKRIVSRNNYNRVDYDYYAKTTHPSVHRNMTPRAVLLKTGLTPLNTVRPVNTAHPKPAVHSAKSMSHFSKQAQSTARGLFISYSITLQIYVRFGIYPKPKGASLAFKRHNFLCTTADPSFVDSGCFKARLGTLLFSKIFKEFDGGYVTFGGGAHGGRISGKGTLKTDSLDFEDVYFVNELKFNLFSVSQMCDKKNYVLFTDTECLVLSPNFKLPDETQILLKIPRKDNMYSFDMKNIVPKESLTCLVAKATLDESMLWHRRLGHINFKNINKLVKDNLVRGLPTKHFENDQTCVACLKGKQHRASCKSKVLNPITNPLFMLHMDLFDPTFMSSLLHKKYCLVVNDDYSREKGIKREYSVARTAQQNGVAERRNMTLIKAARTMLADSKLPTTFWPKAVSTACYVQNRVLVVKPHNKIPYELFRYKGELNAVNTGHFKLNIVDPSVNTASSNDQDSPKDMFKLGASHTLEATHVEFFSDEDEPEVDLGNILNSYTVPTTPNTRIHRDHPIKNVIGDVNSSVQTRRMTKPTNEQGFLSAIKPTSIAKALFDSSWVEAMQEELLQLNSTGLGTCGAAYWKRGLCYSPPGFKDLNNPEKVYKVVKALYGLHQAPRAWYETLANYLLGNGFKREKIDQTLFIKKQKGDILLVQVYVDDIIFGSTNKELCTGFEKLMKDKFQMSSIGELTFFLGLQLSKEDGIFISQDKYVDEILKKFNYTDVKSASTPVDLEKPLVKDGDANDVDVHLYRSMIGSLMYLTTSRPDIMFAVCACARFQVTPKTSHLLAVKRIFRYLKGKLTLGLCDYAGATQDRKSTTRGCQFLGNRLISWQCKKQTVVATSTTEAEYVAAASCCGQFWCTASARTLDNGEIELIATVDGQEKTITEASVRRHLKLANADGISTLPTTKFLLIQLACDGHEAITKRMQWNWGGYHYAYSLEAERSGSYKVTELEDELRSTKAVYNKSLITLTKRGRMIEEIDQDENVNLVKSSKQGEAHETAEHRMESDVDFSTASPQNDDDELTLAETLIGHDEELPQKLHAKELAKKKKEKKKDEESSKQVEEETVQKEDVIPEQVMKESSRKAEGRLKKKVSKAREDKDKRQKKQDDPEKLMKYVEVISDSEEVISVTPLVVKSPIMLNDFDREDLIMLYRLFNEKYASTKPGFDDLMLWGDMKVMFEPDNNDAVWKNHNNQGLIEWKLYDSCGVQSLMLGEVSIHMLVEKKYLLPQDTLTRMLRWKLHVNYNVTEMAYELFRGELDLSMPLAEKTRENASEFDKVLKEEMFEDLQYVQSLEKELDALQYDKDEFSNEYDLLLQE